jgi:hypothetical protein
MLIAGGDIGECIDTVPASGEHHCPMAGSQRNEKAKITFGSQAE